MWNPSQASASCFADGELPEKISPDFNCKADEKGRQDGKVHVVVWADHCITVRLLHTQSLINQHAQKKNGTIHILPHSRNREIKYSNFCPPHWMLKVQFTEITPGSWEGELAKSWRFVSFSMGNQWWMQETIPTATNIIFSVDNMWRLSLACVQSALCSQTALLH